MAETAAPERLWPQRLWLVRHGESAGNLARDAAHAAGLARIDIGQRDQDVGLSPKGAQQADALGRWFADRPTAERPEILWCSPYRRARQTAERILAGGAMAEPATVRFDERLREKEFGILDRLTTRGIAELYPEQAELRRHLGKFYHRPPGGESWCDVILRLRSLLDSILLRHGGQRVLIVGHQVVVLCMRYLLEDLSEEEILAIDATGDVANCAITEYQAEDAGPGRPASLRLVRYNLTLPLQAAGAPITREPGTAEP